MSKYNECYVTAERFSVDCQRGTSYNGFVIGAGYAFTLDKVFMEERCYYGEPRSFYSRIITFQYLDTSEEAVKRSMKGLFNNGIAKYVPSKGDTLSKIASLFDVSVEDIVRWNNITDKNKISAGQPLTIIDIRQNVFKHPPRYQGEIRQPPKISEFESWLEAPSGGFFEGVGKIIANIAYSYINSPTVWLTGRSMAGTSKNSEERAGAFIDFAPNMLLKGTKLLGVCAEVKAGLQGYNAFLKSERYLQNKPTGTFWQQEASRMFQKGKDSYIMNQSASDFLNNASYSLGVWNEIKKKRDE